MTKSKGPSVPHSSFGYDRERVGNRTRVYIHGQDKLTPQMMKVVLDRLAHGGTWSDAARQAGIAPAALSSWRKEVEAALDPANPSKMTEKTRMFVADCESAAAGFRQRLAERIAEAAGSDWKASSWMLERLDPQGWSPPTQRTEITGTHRMIHELGENETQVLAFAIELVTNGLDLPDGRHLDPAELLARFALPAASRVLYAFRQQALTDPVVRQVAEEYGVMGEVIDVTGTEKSA